MSNTFKKSDNSWNDKAKQKSKELKKLKKQLKEVSKSRDKWKTSASKIKEHNKWLENELKKTNNFTVGNRPKKYSFITKIITMITKESLGFMCNVPSHTTILNWVHKIGYYELVKTKEKADDWIIILDESIQFGQEKLLT